MYKEKKWSNRGFYGEELLCKKCGGIAEENTYYRAFTTGRKLRCQKCKIELSIDETTEFSNPEKYKQFIEQFEIKGR